MNLPDSVRSVLSRLQAEERWLAAYERVAALREVKAFRDLIDDLQLSLEQSRKALVGAGASSPLTDYEQGLHRGALRVGDVFVSVMSNAEPDKHKQRALQLQKELDTLLHDTGLTRSDIEVPT